MQWSYHYSTIAIPSMEPLTINWNTLPDYCKSSPSLNVFKSVVLVFILIGFYKAVFKAFISFKLYIVFYHNLCMSCLIYCPRVYIRTSLKTSVYWMIYCFKNKSILTLTLFVFDAHVFVHDAHVFVHDAHVLLMESDLSHRLKLA